MGEWEQRAIDTGLCLFVCNRTGEDSTVSFWEAETMVIKNGKRLISHKSKQSAIIVFDWDIKEKNLVSNNYEVEHWQP